MDSTELHTLYDATEEVLTFAIGTMLTNEGTVPRTQISYRD